MPAKFVTRYETAYKVIVPAIRAKIARELSTKHKMKEEEIAALMNLTQAAISKYLSGKYSERIKKFEEKISNEMVEKHAALIAKYRKEYVDSCICAMCNIVGTSGCPVAASSENVDRILQGKQ